MKTRFFVLISFMLAILFRNSVGHCDERNDAQKGMQYTTGEVQALQIVSSPDLQDLATVWLIGFNNLHPEQKINLSCVTEGDPLTEGNLYLFTNYNPALPDGKSAWKMVIGHDLVVPVISSKNPFIEEINKKGFTAEDFARFISADSNWSMLIEGASKTPVQCCLTDNEDMITKIAGFTKTDQATIRATKVKTAEELISLVKKDVNTIGFCKLTDILTSEKNAFTGQISIIPVDKNRNGRIDSFEDIYSTPESLTKGAWIGKYPRELCGEIYAFSTVKPTNQTALNFLAYVSTDGQQDLIKKSGFSTLSSIEKTANMLTLTEPVFPSEPGNKSTFTSLTGILLIGFVVLVVLSLILFLFKHYKHSDIDSDDIEITPELNVNSILSPRGINYDKTHTWAFMEQDGLVKIGIDDFIKHVTGPLTQLKMRSPGEKIRKGEKMLTVIRDGKQLNLYSPVSGFVRKQNALLLTTPSKINILPYTDGWVYQIEPTNWIREVRFLFMFDKYREWLEDEFIRLKDFLAASANTNRVVYEHIVLQDGGELKDNVLTELSPEVWEDFQTRFIDTSK